MKLTSKQTELMTHVNRVNKVGTYENTKGEFYCECGRWKPFSESTVKALIKRGLIELREGSDRINFGGGVFLIAPKTKTIHNEKT